MTPSAAPVSSNYRPEIDGLRAIAVVGVVLYHANLGVPGGFVGVDVFFVISGFLITGLLLGELARGEIDLRAFWERRVRRILPAVAAVTIATLVAGWFMLFPRDYADLGGAVTAQTLLGANVYYWQHTDYFAAGSEGMALLHTWSLAVEEQFYFLFPLLVIGLAHVRRRPAIILVSGLWIAAFLVSVNGVTFRPRTAFFMLPWRAWELALGAMVAAWPSRGVGPAWLNEVLSVTGLAGIVAGYLCYDSATRTPGLAALAPCLGAALYIWANSVVVTASGRLLSVRPVVWLGLISYSFYLWHWPVWIFGNYLALETLAVPARWALVALSLLLAALSWRYIETPFRRRQWCASRRFMFTWAAVSGALLLAAGIFLAMEKGLPGRLPAAVNNFDLGRSDKAEPVDRQIGPADAVAGRFVAIGSGRPTDPVELFVWGDSHAMAAMAAIDEVCKQRGVHGMAAAHIGTPPLLDFIPDNSAGLRNEAPAMSAAVLTYVRAHRVPRVVLVARWDFYSAGRSAAFHEAFARTLAALREAGAQVWVVTDVPMFPWDVPRALAITALLGRDADALGLAADTYRAQLADQEKEFSLQMPAAFRLLRSAPFLIRGQLAPAAAGGFSLYRDHDHLSAHGAKRLVPMFDEIFSR